MAIRVKGGQVRARNDAFGDEIRGNRRAKGHTQESLAFKLGVDRTTVGKWERNAVSPSPRNIRALVERGLLAQTTGRHGTPPREGWQSLSPELAERVTRRFGNHLSEARVQAARLRDDAEWALIAFFRMLPFEQRRAFLEIISSMHRMTIPEK